MILVIVMLIVVPLLNIKETDNSLTLAVQLVQRMAVYNSTNPSDFSVCLFFYSFFLSFFVSFLPKESSETIEVIG